MYLQHDMGYKLMKTICRVANHVWQSILRQTTCMIGSESRGGSRNLSVSRKLHDSLTSVGRESIQPCDFDEDCVHFCYASFVEYASISLCLFS